MIRHAYVAFGTNEGDLKKNLSNTLMEIGEHGIHLLGIAQCCMSKPAEGVEGGVFMNTVFECGREMPVEKFFAILQRTEATLGAANKKNGGARECDLDLLLWGNQFIAQTNLTVPHPRMLRRDFVLKPLCELIPDETMPGSTLTFREHLERCEENYIIASDFTIET